MYVLLFKDIHFVWFVWSETLTMLANNPITLNNAVNNFYNFFILFYIILNHYVYSTFQIYQ